MGPLLADKSPYNIRGWDVAMAYTMKGLPSADVIDRCMTKDEKRKLW